MMRMKVRAGDRVFIGDIEVICTKRREDPDMSLSVAAPVPVISRDDGEKVTIRAGEVEIHRSRGVSGENIALAIRAPAHMRIVRESNAGADVNQI